MILDFPNLPMESFPEFKGGEKELSAQMYFDGVNRILHGILVPGASIGMHQHVEDCEVLFIVAGHGTIIEDGVSSPVHLGQCVYCPKGHTHSLINSSEEHDLEFYAVVPQQ